MNAVPLNPGAHYRVRFIPGGARVPHEFVGMFLATGELGQTIWSLRPQAGTATCTWEQMLSVQPTIESVRVARKVAPRDR